MSYDAMLSYAHEDFAAANELRAALVDRGLSVWMDVAVIPVGSSDAATLVPAGSSFEGVIRENIDRAAVFVYLDTANWRASDYCQQEQAQAQAQGKRLLSIGPTNTSGSDSRLRADDPDRVAAAIRDGLHIARAHATFLTDAPGRRRPSRWSDARRHSDALVVAHADLQHLGMRLTDDAQARVTGVLRGARQRERVTRLAATGFVVALVVLAVVAVFARRAAKHDAAVARKNADHVQALALAAASADAPNTLQRLAAARRAVALEPGDSTFDALRGAVGAYATGVDLRVGATGAPLAVDVADTGRTIATAGEDGSLTIVGLSAGERRVLVPAATARASARVAVSPSGSSVAAVRNDGAAVELVRPSDGRTLVVPQTADIADLTYVSDEMLVAVRRDGAVLAIDPRSWPRLAIRRLGDVGSPARAMAVASVATSGSPTLAILDDSGQVSLWQPGGGEEPRWTTSLARSGAPSTKLATYQPGQDSIRVCGGMLAVTAVVDLHGQNFYATFLARADRRVRQQGSGLLLRGSVCLPTGDTMYANLVSGPYSIPTEGVEIGGLANDARIRYATASSPNAEWGVAAGSDGTLAVRRLRESATTRDVTGLPQAAVDVGGRTVVATSTGAEVLADRGRPRKLRSPARGPVGRGAFQAGGRAIVPVGRYILSIGPHDVRKLLERPLGITGIRPSADHQHLVVLDTAQRTVAIASLAGSAARTIALPRGLQGGDTSSVWDAVQTTDGDVVVSTRDGRVHLLSGRDGQQIASRQVGPVGRLVLAALDGDRIAVGSSDGFLTVVRGRDLSELARRNLLDGPYLDLQTDPSNRRVLATSIARQGIVVASESLAVLTRSRLGGLSWASLTDRPSRIVYASASLTPDGRPLEGAVGTSPVCRNCDGSSTDLQRLAARITAERPDPGRPSFQP